MRMTSKVIFAAGPMTIANIARFLPILIVLAGCEPLTCTLVVERNVVVEVFDASTGVPAAAGARGWIRDGSHQDTLEAYGQLADLTPVSLAAGYERPGVYQVHIEKQGYVPWDTAGVVVKPGTCHVHTAKITARLRPN